MRIAWWLLEGAMIAGAISMIFLSSRAHAEGKDFEHEIILNLTKITPPGQQDRVETHTMKTLDECWELAKAWTQPDDIGKMEKDVIGLGAGCGVIKKPSQEQ
jgi:hypothetical protein